MTILARTPKQIGQALRRERKKAGLNQTDLAERCGLWQETISKIEGGSPGSRLETVMEICAALNLEIVVRKRTKGDTDYLTDTL